jgi:hypothetical protein
MVCKMVPKSSMIHEFWRYRKDIYVFLSACKVDMGMLVKEKFVQEGR